MRKISEREVQLGELEVLKRIAEICEEQKLRYCLVFGTLIGAVRHHGFIPWDDDIDIAMPRPDYEKLVTYCTEHEKELYPLKLMNYRTNKDYIYPISRLCDTRYYIDYKGAVQYGLGLFVDIYPMDGCGNTKEEQDALVKKNNFLVSAVYQSGQKKFEASKTSILRTPIKLALYCYSKLMGPRYFIKKLEKNSLQHSFESNELVNCTIWDGLGYGYKKSYFEDTILMPFEDAEFRVPREYDEMLRQYYGDYMQLPPEEERVGHHYYEAFLKDESEM